MAIIDSDKAVLSPAQRQLQELLAAKKQEAAQTALTIMPNRIVICPDVSSSMNAQFGKSYADTRCRAAKQAIDKIISASDAKTTAYALLTFNTTPHLIHPMGSPFSRFITTDLYGADGTDIFAALEDALKQNPSRVILLSDGGSYAPPCINIATTVYKPKGIKIDTIAICGKDENPWETGHEELLRQLSEITGGRFASASDPDQLGQLFLNLEPRNYARLEYKP